MLHRFVSPSLPTSKALISHLRPTMSMSRVAKLPHVSVIISNLNGEAYLPRLLQSILAQQKVLTEIFVVDRHSTDDSCAILDAHPEVRIVREPAETGLVAGYAVGATAARYPLFFFCNEDLYLAPHCLAELAAAICTDRDVVAADPWQWNYDGTTWIHGGVRFRPAAWEFNLPYPFRSQVPTVPLRPGERSAFGCAGAIMIDAKAYRAVGGWDTSFFLDDEDLDLFIRTWQRGWTCVTVPSARVFHAVGASNTKRVGKVSVNRRRYVSNRSNVSIVALKYFSARWVGLGVLMWVVTTLKDLLLLRPRRVWLDFLVFFALLGRLPAVIGFRRVNGDYNRRRPGERFFIVDEHAEPSYPCSHEATVGD